MVKNIFYLSMMFFAVPACLGYAFVRILRLKGRFNRLLHAWIIGFAEMLAVAQVVLVPLVAMQQTLSLATSLWKMLLSAIAAASFLLWLFARAAEWEGEGESGALTGDAVAIAPGAGLNRQSRGDALEKESRGISAGPVPGESLGSGAEPDAGGNAAPPGRGDLAWGAALGILALVLILIQAYIPARYQHSDDDDARFIAEEVSAVAYDTMYKDSPITADFLYWNVGEVRKDLSSPWAMFVAMVSKESGIAPAILSHSYLPFFLILLCYGVYAAIGRKLFRGDAEKTFVFLIVLSVIHLAGYTSTHTLASMLLLRIWQGKAVCASFMLPFLFYLFYQIMNRDCYPGWIALLYVASTGACLLSGIGIVTAPIVLFLYGLVDFCCYRDWKKLLSIWMAAAPCGVFLLYYLL